MTWLPKFIFASIFELLRGQRVTSIITKMRAISISIMAKELVGSRSFVHVVLNSTRDFVNSPVVSSNIKNGANKKVIKGRLNRPTAEK